jgi:hypothetical protein
MKSQIREILGKKISGVVVKEGEDEPKTQIFLLFSDGTHYEFYGIIHGTGGVDRGGIKEVRQYMASKNRKIVLEVLDETFTGEGDTP